MLKNYTKIKVDEYGNKHYFNDERTLHRLDGPAVEYLSGPKYWYINGNYHRNIDPSSEHSSGKVWGFKDKLHRIGGSVSLYEKFWRIYDEIYNKQDYFNKVWDI